MVDQIFKNYDAFYNMVLSTTLMSNAQTQELENDARKIIKFIGEAYKFSDDFINFCSSVILDTLSKLGRTTDQQAVYSRRSFSDTYSDEDSLLDIKGSVLATIEKISLKNNGCIEESWFDYSHYKTYQANVRYSKIVATSATGNVITTRQAGILSALGIGCEVDMELATMRLTQCAFWGDIPAMYYLGYAYLLCGNTEKSNLFYEVASLSKKYLFAGYTVIPEKAKALYSEKARIYYVYISSIFQDIVHTQKVVDINFSFIEAITSDKIDYFKRMSFINNYSDQQWKEITNSSQSPTKKLGFN